MNNHTLMELVAEYLDWQRSRNYSPGTTVHARRSLTRSLRWMQENQRVSGPEQMRAATLEAWRRHVVGRVTSKGRPHKPRTVNKAIEQMKGFLKFLAKRGYLGQHLEEGLEYVKEPHVLPGSVLTHTQTRELLESVAADSPAGYTARTVLEVLYSSGIRAGELVGLDLDHLDLANGTAKVTGKGSKDRVVPIGKTALGFLENYIKAVRPFLVKDPENKALFLDKFGKRLPYHTLRRLVHAFAEKRGVPVNVTPHTFRRSCATELLRAGAGMYHVKDLLGHESLETLRHYAKLTIRDLKKEHQRGHPRERDTREIGR